VTSGTAMTAKRFEAPGTRSWRQRTTGAVTNGRHRFGRRGRSAKPSTEPSCRAGLQASRVGQQ
jgi:hypothetical protein